MKLIVFDDIRDKIITLRSKQVIIDSDVAMLYGVETKRVNEAVKNNPDKFPTGYVFELDPDEKREVVEIFDHPAQIKLSPALPKAFSEKGLYMLATILKSPQATATTIAIVEAFAKLRELSRAVAELAEEPEKERQKSLMQRSGEIIADMLDDGLKTTDSETSIELNLAVLKVKHTVKRKQE